MFATHNADGTPKKCKFCGEHVWWDTNKCRWINPDGKTYHTETCATSKSYYRGRALDASEAKRHKARGES